MPKHALEKTTGHSKRGAAEVTSLSSRFLSTSEDVEQFEAAARAYTKKHARNKATALKALQKMGMVTATGRLTKRYS